MVIDGRYNVDVRKYAVNIPSSLKKMKKKQRQQ